MKENEMKLAFTTLGCPKWSLREIVDNAAAMGYEGVDFRGIQQHIDITGMPEFTTRLAETQRLFADNGIEIAGIYGSAKFAVVDPTVKQTHVDEARRNMELAAKVGAPIVRVYGGKVPDGYTVETIMPYLVENLRSIGDEAEQYGVTLVLETHDDWTDSSVFKTLMDEVNHPRVRVLWDLHHPYRTNGEPIDATFQNLRPYTDRIHVKDSRANPDGSHTYTLLGEGDTPVRRGLDLLVESGYTGYATFEWEKRWHDELAEPEVAFPQFVQKMREWLG
jgi:sugar phosphate isomerase/epimerase